MHDGSAHNDTLVNSKKILLKAQKLLLLASVRNDALTLREYRQVLAECLQPEASASLKVIGFQLAHHSPTCSTSATWSIVMDALVTELASSEDLSVLKNAIPLFDVIPVIILIDFLIASEKTPLNKLRNLLSHVDVQIHCLAIATLARLSIRIACSLADEILQSLPFESHETRIICLQDINLILIDIQKLICQDLFALNESIKSEAFKAMSNLFSQSALVQQFLPKETKSSACLRTNALALNDLVCLALREALPAICSLVKSVDLLPNEMKVDGLHWLAVVLCFLMDRTGARCPGISVPYLTVDYDHDTLQSSQLECSEDDLSQPSTQRLRVDQFAHDFFTEKLHPILRDASFFHATTLCRASFHLMLHPLLEFSRFHLARPLLDHLIAQCYHQETIEAREEIATMLYHTFLWLPASDCLQAFTQTMDALLLVDRERGDPHFVPHLLHGIVSRVLCQSELVLLKLLCHLDLFEAFRTEKIATAISIPATCSLSQLLQAQITVPSGLRKRSLVKDLKALENVPASQILVIGSFSRLLYPFPQSKPSDIDHLQSGFMALLMDHFCRAISGTQYFLQESLQLMAELLDTKAYQRIVSQKVRLQLVSLALRLIPKLPTLSLHLLFTHLDHEISLIKSSFPPDKPTIFSFDQPSRNNTCANTGGQFEIVSALLTCSKLLTTIQSSESMKIENSIMEMVSIISSIKRADYMFLSQFQSKLQPPVDTSPYLEDWFLPCCYLPLFNIDRLFAPDPFTSNRTLEWDQASVVVSGGSDPLTISASYRHTDPSQRDRITLIVSACNVTNLEMNDVELYIRYSSNVSSESKCNDLVLNIRPHVHGTALLPNGTIRIERKFHVHCFSRSTFGFQLVFKEEKTTGNDNAAVVERTKLAACDPFVVGFDALLKLKDEVASPSAAVFRVMWQSAEARCAFSVVSTASQSIPLLSFAQTLIKASNACMHILPDLLIDSTSYIHIAYVAQTHWKTRILASLVLTARHTKDSSGEWFGSLEIRSSKAVIDELQSATEDCLRVFVGNHLRLDHPHAHAAEPFETLVNESVLYSSPQHHSKLEDARMLNESFDLFSMSTVVP
uniref:Uncharacterized protein AlNc14C38G3299 n=1 Tax=Albugo laibachii Nc14 TaxID=890382 RepID=F0W928_9STRA|nr:conserved hypothetical protein [Albugo laibachii Nc14]|eukprot:CCA17640.1 conserved hypothetical protein [Albugo laibachii Nc14]